MDKDKYIVWSSFDDMDVLLGDVDMVEEYKRKERVLKREHSCFLGNKM